jgi:hypothetical protein
MANLFGALGLNDTDRVFAGTTGQAQVWEAVQAYVTQHNADLQAAMAVFVEGETENHIERYYMPGTGRMPRRGEQAQAAATKRNGAWDVAYPLEDFGDQVAGDMVAMAYMTAADLSNHLLTVQQRDINNVRYEVLKALLNSSNGTFVDPLRGSLTIRRLANADGTLYPAVLGSESETSSHTHYIETNYASSSISDTNDPIVTAVDHLEEHFGAPTGGSNIAVFINNAQTAKIAGLTEFVDNPNRFVQPGTNTATPTGLPMALPGKTLGVHNKGAIVQEWRWVPANYIIAVHLDAPKPLKMRVDPADTGLPRGLALVAQDEDTPWRSSHWMHRFGIGVGNRLNGVVLELGTGGSYSVPSGY